MKFADLPGGGKPLEGVEAFATALADYPDVATTASSPSAFTLDRLGTAVATAKRDYQACRYSTVIDYLPGLLADLRTACETLDGDDLLHAHALSADAHHVAASILLKLDDEGRPGSPPTAACEAPGSAKTPRSSDPAPASLPTL